MKKTKQFDCVQMKWDIQRKLRDEFPAMTEEEKRRLQTERVERSPILGPFLRRVRRKSNEI